MSGPVPGIDRIVALGGGHGLYATLTAMRYLSPDITAIVTVADDGGSSGRLRGELNLIPPGDLRMLARKLAPQFLQVDQLVLVQPGQPRVHVRVRYGVKTPA